MARDFSAALGQVGRKLALLETGVPWRLDMAIGHIPVLSRLCVLFPGFDESNSRFDPASGDVVLSRKPTFLLPEPSLSTRIWFLPGFFRENRDWRQGDPGIRRGGSRTNPLKVAENFAKVERSTIGSGGRGDARSQTIGIARTTSIPGSCRTKRPASPMIPLAPGSMNEKAERVRRKGEPARQFAARSQLAQGPQDARASPEARGYRCRMKCRSEKPSRR
jgi:hypothetical protein